jgi:sporulation integral membrane protein YtvI
LSQSDKREFLSNVVFIAVILAIGYIFIQYLAVWMMPFVVGMVLALILQGPVNWVLRHTHLKRKMVAPVVTLVLVMIIIALLVLLLVSAVGEAAKFVASLPVWFQNTAPLVVDAMTKRLEIIIEALPQDWETQIRGIVSDELQMMQSEVGGLSATVLSWVANSAASLPSLLISFIVSIVATFFLCSKFDRVKGFFWRQVPGKYKELAGDTWATFAHTLGQMIRSYILIMFITFCEVAVGLSLMRVEYSLLLAALISLVDIMPVIGTGTILIPWGLIALLTGNMGLGAGLLLLYVVVTVVRNILEPRIIGRRIGIHPLITLVFMYLGLHILGIPGMFLFPLLFVLLKNAQEAGMIRLWKN